MVRCECGIGIPCIDFDGSVSHSRRERQVLDIVSRKDTLNVSDIYAKQVQLSVSYEERASKTCAEICQFHQ
jgi:hypothetical protein